MQLDIFHDLICPWCFIGKRRLERALAARPRPALRIRWQPFQLNPNMPKPGMDRHAYLATKFGGIERAAQAYAAVADTAARDGLILSLDRIRRTPNTLDAHRLVRLVEARTGRTGAVVEALFCAYFQQGRDIGDLAVLAGIAGDCGVDPEEAAAWLSSEAEVAAVRTADAVARQIGIQAVPSFVFDRRFALSGAQEPSAFFPLFDLVANQDGHTVSRQSIGFQSVG